MAERSLKTKFEIDGAEEYKNAVGQINSKISVLNAEMKKVTAEYQDNGNSAEALSKKNEILSQKLEEQKKRVDECRKALEQAKQQYGENSEVTDKYTRELYNAEAAVATTENAIKKNNETMQGSTATLGDLAEAFGVHLPDGMSSALDSIKGFSTASVAAVGTFAAAITAAIKVTTQMVNLTREMAASADETLTLAQVTGLDTDTIQEMQYASELIDVSFDTIRSSMTKLTNKMQDAQDGSEDTAEAFRKLGVKITDSEGNLRSAEDVWYDTIDALGGIENQTERDATAMDLMGKSAQDLNPLIKSGSEALKDFAKEAEDVGYVMSDEQLTALGKVDDAYQRLTKTQDAIKEQMAAELAPAVEELYTSWTAFMENAAKALVDSGMLEMLSNLLTTVSGMINPVDSLAEDGIPKLTTAFEAFKVVIGAVAQFVAVIADAFDLLYSVATLDWSGVKQAIGFGYAYGDASNLQRTQMVQDGTWDQYYQYYHGDSSSNASGDANFRGGWTRISENGAEMAYLPQGSTILNSQDTREAIGGDTYNITIDAKSVREFNDIVSIVKSSRMAARMG